MTADLTAHYIELTVTIGPISPPYKLHILGEPMRVTAHGRLAERLYNAVWEVAHNADCSAHITTEAESLPGPIA